jgi:transketolase
VPDLMDRYPGFRVGKAVRLRDGNALSLFACGHMVNVAMQAAELLAARGVDIRVLNTSTIKPLDTEAIIQAVRGVSLAVTLEEHSIIGGLGSAVAEVLAEGRLMSLVNRELPTRCWLNIDSHRRELLIR